MDDRLRNLPRSKKVRELALLLSFLDRVHLRPEHIMESERPDFELGWETPQPVDVGVELTEFSAWTNRKGSRYRQIEAKLATLAKALPPDLYVELEGETADLLRLVPERLAKDIQEWCGAGIGLSAGPTASIGQANLRISRRAGATQVWWTGLRTGEAPELQPALERCLEAKRSSVPGYKEKGRPVWLVICAIPARLDSYGVVIDQLALKQDTGPFECVLFWDAFLENVWRIDADTPRILVDSKNRSLHVNALPSEVRPLVAVS